MFSFTGIAGVFLAGGILMLLAALLIALRVSVGSAPSGAGAGPALHL